MADIRPTIFVGIFPGWRDILDVHGADAGAVVLDPLEGIATTANDPGNVCFPRHAGCSVEDQFLGKRTIGQGLEFEIVIVPAENITCLAIDGMRRFKALSECRPAGGLAGLAPMPDADNKSLPCRAYRQYPKLFEVRFPEDRY